MKVSHTTLMAYVFQQNALKYCTFTEYYNMFQCFYQNVLKKSIFGIKKKRKKPTQELD